MGPRRRPPRRTWRLTWLRPAPAGPRRHRPPRAGLRRRPRHKTGWPGYDRACTAAPPDRFHLPARALATHQS
jgi:hypothetical protein